MDVKLQKCAPNLPEGFFPHYTNVKEYCEIIQYLKSGKEASTNEKCASAKKVCRLNKNLNSKHPHENLAGKDSNEKETREADNKDKSPQNPKKMMLAGEGDGKKRLI